MEEVTLTRLQHFKGDVGGPLCIRGVMTIGNSVFYTLEPPDLDNASNISCIPKGTYECVIRKSPKYGVTYHVTNVTDRSFILMHAGNVARHTKGCILIGSRFGTLYGQPAVLASKPAVRKFNDLMEGDPFMLIIE
jgi:hypothetical protein